MGASKLQLLSLAAAAATAGMSSTPTGAQCRLCATPVTSREDSAAKQDVQIEVQSSVNFDRLILFGEGDGAATIRPDGSRAAEGAVTGVGPRAMVGTATVHGEAGRAVRVELPTRIELYSLSGGRIAFDDVVSDLPPMPRLDSAGNLSFRFGGRVKISGGAGGDYRGDLPITVEYQ